MVIEGEAPVEVLSSKKGINAASNSKKPFAFIERTWEVKNPTEEDVSLVTSVFPIPTAAAPHTGVASLQSVEWWEPRSASSQPVILKAASGRGLRAIS